ncbi:unnamed protein product [Caretta caretta]
MLKPWAIRPKLLPEPKTFTLSSKDPVNYRIYGMVWKEQLVSEDEVQYQRDNLQLSGEPAWLVEHCCDMSSSVTGGKLLHVGPADRSTVTFTIPQFD